MERQFDELIFYDATQNCNLNTFKRFTLSVDKIN